MKFAVLVFLLCFPVAGFAAAADPPPSYEKIAKIPVIRLGEPLPGKDYILLFEPGQPISMTFTIEGNLFSQPSTADLVVTPSRTIFIYKEWASLDGMKWVQRSELIKSDVIVKVPGYNYPNQGVLKVRMDLNDVK